MEQEKFKERLKNAIRAKSDNLETLCKIGENRYKGLEPLVAEGRLAIYKETVGFKNEQRIIVPGSETK